MPSTPFELSDIRLGVARGVSYGLFGPPDDVAAARRELTSGTIRLYVYWGQVQPEPDRWDWTMVDSFLAQLGGEEEVWVTCPEQTDVANTMSNSYRENRNETERLQPRLGPVAWRSSGDGPALVFFAGALANGDLWRDVVAALSDRYRCITVDLPFGAHPWPLSNGADRSATSLARLLLDCLEQLDVDDATVIANDTAGGLLLLSLATGHQALGRVSRLVLTNGDSYDQFPPDGLRAAARLYRAAPRLARALLRLQLRFPSARRKVISTVAATGLDDEHEQSFLGPAGRDRQVADDLVAALAGFRPELLVDAADAIPRFDRPVLLIWGDADDFFPPTHADRLASEFPHARERGLPPAQIALAWLLHQPGVTAPIIGATKSTHIDDATAAARVSLTTDELGRLEAAYRPHPPVEQ